MVTLLFMIGPFWLLTIWYAVDKSEKHNMMNKLASSVRSYCLDSTTITTDNIVKDHVEDFDAIHDMFDFVFKVATAVITIALVVWQKGIDIRVKLVTIFLFLILCLANFVYGYSKTSAKIIWLLVGLICFFWSLAI